MNVLSKITIIRNLYEEAEGHPGQGLLFEASYGIGLQLFFSWLKK